jgi:hypothetical protein
MIQKVVSLVVAQKALEIKSLQGFENLGGFFIPLWQQNCNIMSLLQNS